MMTFRPIVHIIKNCLRGSAWQVIQMHQERILQMCNRWNQAGKEQEQSAHQWALLTVKMCIQQ